MSSSFNVLKLFDKFFSGRENPKKEEISKKKHMLPKWNSHRIVHLFYRISHKEQLTTQIIKVHSSVENIVWKLFFVEKNPIIKFNFKKRKSYKNWKKNTFFNLCSTRTFFKNWIFVHLNSIQKVQDETFIELIFNNK